MGGHEIMNGRGFMVHVFQCYPSHLFDIGLCRYTVNLLAVELTCYRRIRCPHEVIVRPNSDRGAYGNPFGGDRLLVVDWDRQADGDVALGGAHANCHRSFANAAHAG